MHGQGMGGMGWWLSKRPGRESPLWRAPVHPLWRGTSPPPAAVWQGERRPVTVRRRGVLAVFLRVSPALPRAPARPVARHPPPPDAASSTTVGLPQRPPSLLASKRQLPPPRAGSAWPGRTGPAHAVRGRGGGRATPARGTPRRGTIIMAAAAAATGAAATAKRPQPPSWLSPQPPLGRAVDVGWEWVGRGGGRARCQTGVRACHAGGGAW